MGIIRERHALEQRVAAEAEADVALMFGRFLGMTFSRPALVLFLSCGCAHAPTSVTVTTARPRAQAQVETPEPAEDFGCGVFAKDGVSESKDAYRACLERAVAADKPCEGGGSPDLATLELAVALVDGTGGPADVPRARKLLAGCFRDVAVDAVIAHADEKERDPRARSLEKCDQFAQTTFAITECLHEHIQNERAWLRRTRRSYDTITRPVFDAATRAAEAWQMALGTIDYTRYAGGTMRDAALLSRVYAAMKKRRERLEVIRGWIPSPTMDASERASARDRLANALRLIENGAEPAEQRALHDEERAWSVYRDAEADLYEALHTGTRARAISELAYDHANDMSTLVRDP